MEVSVFNCSICGDTSHNICVYCTKDACEIHLCDRCHRCSDCCVCDQPQIRHDVQEAFPHDGVVEADEIIENESPPVEESYL